MKVNSIKVETHVTINGETRIFKAEPVEDTINAKAKSGKTKQIRSNFADNSPVKYSLYVDTELWSSQSPKGKGKKAKK